MSRKGENIYRRKDGRYEGRYIKNRMEDGKVHYGYIYGKKYHDVKNKLILKKADQSRTVTEILSCGDMDFTTWSMYWMNSYKRNRIKDSTYQSYNRMLNNHILPCMKQMKLKDVTSKIIQDVIQKMEVNNCAPTTIRNVYHLLNAIFKDALFYHAVPYNPCVRVSLPKMITQQQRVLTRREQAILEHYCIPRYPEILFCLWTGVRLGELCALTWAQIDFVEGLIQIEHTLQRIQKEKNTQIIITVPKTISSRRQIPMVKPLVKILHELKQHRKPSLNDYVFQSAHHKYSDPRTIQKKFQRIAAKLELANVHIHTLRHTFATRCIESGIDFKTLSSIMGHSSAKITMDVYVHTTVHQKKASIRKLETTLYENDINRHSPSTHV